ncbi:MAG: dTDP-4-dehydrorhamnose reductase [Brevefilum sp.]|jgi:dTDP-4-dehydrorhamnose reductase
MKTLLLGTTGQVGWELNRTLLPLGDLVAMDYPQIDMSNPDQIRSIVREHRPDLIINATAYTDVDKSESLNELAMAINDTGPGVLAEEALRLNAGLIHFSTDYVFDGTATEPYLEEDQPNPLGVYGESKLAGEKSVEAIGGAYLIFRTSWVYSLRRQSFVTKVLQWARQYETLRVVDDQISTPTWARDLAEITAQVIAQGRGNAVGYIAERAGLYHLTDQGSCSRFEWAKMILQLDPDKETQIVKSLQPAKTIEFPAPATRPLHSILSCKKFQDTFSIPTPPWDVALRLSME